MLNTLFDLTGRTALVTGAGGWLGAPMAEGLAEHGAMVWLNGRRTQPLEEQAEALIKRGFQADILPFDMTDHTATKQALNKIKTANGQLDILINNAYGGAPAGSKTSEAEAFEIAGSQVSALWHLTQESMQLLKAATLGNRSASIINVASMYGKVSPDPRIYKATDQPPNPPFYGVAKGGILQLTRWLACNLGEDNIRANTISPGPFPQWNARERAPEFVVALDAKTPLGRVGQRREIKGAAIFLASDASSYVTGTDIAVDGGWTAW